MKQGIYRLMFVTDAPHFGGAERYVLDLSRAAAKRGIDTTICWLKPAGAVEGMFAEAEQYGTRVIVLERPARAWAMAAAAHRIMRRHRPDAVIVNACGRAGFWTVPWVARFNGAASAWVHHMVDGQDYRRCAPRRFGGRMEGLHLWRVPQTLRHRLAALAASAVVVLNVQDRDRVMAAQGISPSRIRVIANGVDTQVFRFDAAARRAQRARWLDETTPPDALVIGSAGRLVDGKRMELLIESARLLRDRHVPCVMVIAGDGPARQGLQERARALGLQNIVHFEGFVEDMPAFYSGLDVFVLASATESFGLVITEAMACERPVVATPTAGACRQIEHERCGWILRQAAAGELADLLMKLHEDRSTLMSAGRLGRERVLAQFTLDRTLDETLDALSPAKARAIRNNSWVRGSSQAHDEMMEIHRRDAGATCASGCAWASGCAANAAAAGGVS